MYDYTSDVFADMAGQRLTQPLIQTSTPTSDRTLLVLLTQRRPHSPVGIPNMRSRISTPFDHQIQVENVAQASHLAMPAYSYPTQTIASWSQPGCSDIQAS